MTDQNETGEWEIKLWVYSGLEKIPRDEIDAFVDSVLSAISAQDWDYAAFVKALEADDD